MAPGEKIRITGGGYKGSTGVIEEIDGDLAKVRVDFFGAPLSARIPLNQLASEEGQGAAGPSAAGQPVALSAGLRTGDSVKVTGGGYKGSTGVIEDIEGELGRVRVESFGVPMSARIPLSQLEKVNG